MAPENLQFQFAFVYCSVLNVFRKFTSQWKRGHLVKSFTKQSWKYTNILHSLNLSHYVKWISVDSTSVVLRPCLHHDGVSPRLFIPRGAQHNFALLHMICKSAKLCCGPLNVGCSLDGDPVEYAIVFVRIYALEIMCNRISIETTDWKLRELVCRTGDHLWQDFHQNWALSIMCNRI